VDRGERELGLTRARAALSQAVVLGFRGRTHLSEQNTGLANAT
jgi:hypothetical protein